MSKILVKNRTARAQRCPYLGLHDDPTTALAYPSTWNYCYHATPPGPVVTSHQGDVCLTPLHVKCVVYLTGQTDPLPAGLRTPASRKQLAFTSRKPGRLLLFLVPAALLLLVVLFLLPRSPFRGMVASLPGLSSVLALVDREVSPAAPSPAPAPSSISRSTPGSPPVPASPPADEATLFPGRSTMPATAPSTFSLENACGHALEVPFGEPVRLVLHRVLGGDSVTLYARQYETTPEAILTVNYRLPVPLRPDGIIVIPVGTMAVYGLPAFEVHESAGTDLSLEELAGDLEVDAQSLYRYNDFEGPCTAVSGWLLVPRETGVPE